VQFLAKFFLFTQERFSGESVEKQFIRQFLEASVNPKRFRQKKEPERGKNKFRIFVFYPKNQIMAKNTIEHDGIVIKVADRFIIVAIQNQSACATCHSKGACGLSEVTQKNITAEKPDTEVKIGDRVIVSASTGNAMLSVLLAYVVPSALILATLTLLVVTGFGEIAAAALSLLTIAAYFIILYLFRDKFAQKIKFKVKIA